MLDGRRQAALTILVALALAGCGGAAGPSAPDSRAAAATWARQADAICTSAVTAIAGRGGPADLVTADRIAVRAARDVDGAVAALGRLRVPSGAAGRARPVLAAARALPGLLRRLTGATAGGRADRVVAAALALRAAGQRFERAAHAAGLRSCGRSGRAAAAADALIAPAFAGQVAAFDRALGRRIKASLRVSRPTVETVTRAFRRTSGIVFVWLGTFDRLNPPTRARTAAMRYRAAIRGIGRAAAQAARVVRRHGGFTPATVGKVDRRLRLAGRLATVRYRLLLRALRPAPPAKAPGPDDPTAPDGGDAQVDA